MSTTEVIYLVGSALIVVGAVYIYVQHRQNVNNVQRSLLSDAKILEAIGMGWIASLLYECCMLNAYRATQMVVEKLKSIKTKEDALKATSDMYKIQTDIRWEDPDERRQIENRIGRKLEGDGNWTLVAVPIEGGEAARQAAKDAAKIQVK